MTNREERYPSTICNVYKEEKLMSLMPYRYFFFKYLSTTGHFRHSAKAFKS